MTFSATLLKKEEVDVWARSPIVILTRRGAGVIPGSAPPLNVSFMDAEQGEGVMNPRPSLRTFKCEINGT